MNANFRRPGPPQIDGHQPDRPAWTCAVDGDQWPCRQARRLLQAEFQHDPAGLTYLMATWLVHAVHELPDEKPSTLARRFMLWFRH